MCVCVCICVCVCVRVCVGSIMCVVCVCVCVCVCACPETVNAVLEFTFCSYLITIIFHIWMCVFVTVYTCV